MISVNKHDVNSAIEYYKRVITEFPSSPEAQDALSGLENVYQESDRSDEFLAFLDKTGLSSVKSATEKELMLYNTGERQFLNSNYTSAINTLKRYITNIRRGTDRQMHTTTWENLTASSTSLKMPSTHTERLWSMAMAHSPNLQLSILPESRLNSKIINRPTWHMKVLKMLPRLR
jgi:tetratricopeptide (TPR) repeat protein